MFHPIGGVGALTFFAEALLNAREMRKRDVGSMVGWGEDLGGARNSPLWFCISFFLPAVKKVVVLWMFFRGALLGSTYHGLSAGGGYRRSIYLVCGVCGGVGGNGNFSLTGEEGAEELTRGPMMLLVF